MMKTFDEILEETQVFLDNGSKGHEYEDLLKAMKIVHDQAVELCVEHLQFSPLILKNILDPKTKTETVIRGVSYESIKKVKDMI